MMKEILLKLLVATLIFFSGILIGRKTNKPKKVKKLLFGEESMKKNEKANQLASQIKHLEKINEGLINENTELRKEIYQLQEDKFKQVNSSIESNPIQSLDQENKDLDNSVKIQNKSTEPQTISTFFNYPEGDGSFKMIHGSSIKDGDSFFEIVYKENQKEGELKFIADRGSFGKILTVRDSSLRPVSEIEIQGGIDKPSSITVIENGVVEIKEDRFIIKDGHKLKLRVS